MARFIPHTSLLPLSLSLVVGPTSVLARDAAAVETVIVTGTRDATRTQFDTCALSCCKR